LDFFQVSPFERFEDLKPSKDRKAVEPKPKDVKAPLEKSVGHDELSDKLIGIKSFMDHPKEANKHSHNEGLSGKRDPAIGPELFEKDQGGKLFDAEEKKKGPKGEEDPAKDYVIEIFLWHALRGKGQVRWRVVEHVGIEVFSFGGGDKG